MLRTRFSKPSLSMRTLRLLVLVFLKHTVDACAALEDPTCASEKCRTRESLRSAEQRTARVIASTVDATIVASEAAIPRHRDLGHRLVARQEIYRNRIHQPEKEGPRAFMPLACSEHTLESYPRPACPSPSSLHLHFPIEFPERRVPISYPDCGSQTIAAMATG